MQTTLTILATAFIGGSLVSCDGKKAPITEENRGYNEGVRETRKAQNEAGIIGAAVQETKVMFGAGKEGKSDDFNAGYRQGVKEELNKTYPDK